MRDYRPLTELEEVRLRDQKARIDRLENELADARHELYDLCARLVDVGATPFRVGECIGTSSKGVRRAASRGRKRRGER